MNISELDDDDDIADDWKYYDGDFIDGLHNLGVMDLDPSAVSAVRADGRTIELS